MVCSYDRRMATQTSDRTIRLSIAGMHCAGCAASARAKLTAVAGVDRADVDFATGVAMITPIAGESPSEATLHAAIRRAGFEPAILARTAPEKAGDGFAALIELRASAQARLARQLRIWSRSTYVAGGLWIVLETLHWTAGHHAHASGWVGWAMFVGATISLLVAGRGFYSSAWTALRLKSTNMDTLVVVGVSAAYSLSAFTFFAQRFGDAMHDAPLYFAEASALLAIISLGHWIESRAANRANSAIQELLQLQPQTVERLADDSTTSLVALSDIAIGDRVAVRPGARIPTDGILTAGQASIDESSLTGEPLAVVRTVGERVSAGTIPLDGALVVRVTATGNDSAVGRIAQIVYRAQISQAPIQRLADRVCQVFVPAVLIIALATFVGWWWNASLSVATLTAVTVLVISCPCALGIATPLALVVGTGAASRRGILVRDAAILQSVASLRTVAFDKTGTITKGRPVLERIERIDNKSSEADVLALAAAAELQSEHPLGRAVVAAATAAGVRIPEATDFSAQAGIGVQVMCDGKRVRVRRDEVASARLEVDDVLIARLHMVDEVRAESREAIGQLRAQGCAVALITGDRAPAALKIAHDVGIAPSEVFSEQTPESKVAVINRLHAQSVMMVGDGINDAAALATAAVGVAMGSATALATESADVMLLRDDPRDVAVLVDIARKTFAVVRQNLFLAFAYNALAIPLAVSGVLGAKGPLIAAAAMGLSDLSVVGNTLWLRRRLSREGHQSLGAGHASDSSGTHHASTR